MSSYQNIFPSKNELLLCVSLCVCNWLYIIESIAIDSESIMLYIQYKYMYMCRDSPVFLIGIFGSFSYMYVHVISHKYM